MTGYGSMSHQQLYDYVNSGSPTDVQSEADLSTSHGKSVTNATNDLQQTLTKIQSSWSGAAADQFSQQANAIVSQMQEHAQNADQVGAVMKYAAQYLTWAQKSMPSPPSEAERLLADVNSNAWSEIGGAVMTGGASYVASKAAQEDIARKKTVATQVMTQLAGAYTQAQSQLRLDNRGFSQGGTDSGYNGNNKTKADVPGNSNSSNSNAGGGGGIMPMPVVMPIGSNGSRNHEAGGTGGHASPGHVSVSKPTTTVTSGVDNQPNPGVGGAEVPGGTISGVGGASGLGSNSGTVGGLGGSASGPGSLDDEPRAGLGGAGEFGGSTRDTVGGAGTKTGELGEEASGTGYGARASTGSSSSLRPSDAAGVEGEAAAGSSNAEQGMMGEMSPGGMGGGRQEERGSRANWLKEDPDYWYGDKMKNAAPPGGVIE